MPTALTPSWSAGTATLTPTQRQALIEAAQHDPVWFITHVLGADLWATQREIARAVWTHRRTAVRACRRSGKSYAAAHIVLAFLYAFPDAVVLTTAPAFRQVEFVLWQEIRRAWQGSRVPLGGTLLQTSLRVRDGWFALGLTADEPTAFQGINARHSLVIVDEAPGLRAEMWVAIEGLLAGGHGRVLMLGNPTELVGPFRDEFTRPGTATFRISAFDTPNLTQDHVVYPGLITRPWVEERRAAWGEGSMMYQAHVLGEFPDAAADSLLPFSWLAAARARTLVPGEPNTLGVDVAWQGDDETTIVHRQGAVARVVGVSRHEDPMQTAGRVVQARRDTGATRIYVDVIGLGAGVVARLQELGEPVTGVNVAERARNPEQFANRRAELFFGLRQRFQDGDVALAGNPADLDELVADLAALRLPPPNSRGQIVLEAKDKTKQALGRSPDRADALMLAFADVRRAAFNLDAIACFA